MLCLAQEIRRNKDTSRKKLKYFNIFWKRSVSKIERKNGETTSTGQKAGTCSPCFRLQHHAPEHLFQLQSSLPCHSPGPVWLRDCVCPHSPPHTFLYIDTETHTHLRSLLIILPAFGVVVAAVCPSPPFPSSTPASGMAYRHSRVPRRAGAPTWE